MKLTQVTPEMIACMNPADQARFAPGTVVSIKEPPKVDLLEREEQRLFWHWLHSHDYPAYWHSTAHRTRATKGYPDFTVGVAMITLYIEFKSKGKKLSPDQVVFRDQLARQGIELHVVNEFVEARDLVLRHNAGRLNP